MGKICEVCGKGVMSGNHVAHSKKATRRIWAPNTQKLHNYMHRHVYIQTPLRQG